jgi:hypothetical protein
MLLGEECKLCSFLQPPVTSYPFGPNILLSTLFINTFSLFSSLNITDHVSHTYKATRKIMLLHILVFTFLASRREDKRLWTEW